MRVVTVVGNRPQFIKAAAVSQRLREVHPVRAIDGRALPEPPGPLTRAAAERMRAHIEQELAAPAG